MAVDISSQITCESSKQRLFMRFSGRWISEESFISNGFVLFQSGNQTELSMKEIFLDVICAVLFEKPLSSVLRTLSVNTVDRANQPCGAS